MTISKKKQKYILGAVIAVAALIAIVHPFYEIKFTDSRTDCFPYKMWYVDKMDKAPSAGDFIMFRTPTNAGNYFPQNKKWIKKVLATSGGQVDVIPAGKGETSVVFMRGMERKLPVRARVTVTQGKTRETFVAFAADSLDRVLPLIKKQLIPAGEYYLYSPIARSYDSRYWGLVKKDEILGTAYPVF